MSGVVDRARRALRGPHLAILAVLTMFLIDCLTYRNIQHVAGLPLRWPIETWQMYSRQSRTEPLVRYRRFLIHTRDGHSAPTSLDEIPFLSRAYRIDAGLSHDQPGLMEIVLRELSRQDANIVGFTYETRDWAYQQRTLAEHIAQDPPIAAYTARWIAERPAAPRAPANLLVNGDFEAFEPAGGLPKAWTASKSAPAFFGFGLDPRGDHAFRFGDSPTSAVIRQTVQLTPATAPRTLRVRARVLAPHGNAYLEVLLGTPLRGTSAWSPRPPSNPSWQALTAALEVPADASAVTVVLHGTAGTLFDDVVLTVEP